MKTKHLTLLSGLLAVLLFSSTAQAWWNSDWTLRKKITIDPTTTGAGITDPIGTTPVLIRLHDGNFQFQNAKEDGSDLRFVAADDKTLLVYHIEKIDPILNEAFVWVKVPNVKPGEKITFWLYYGNSGSKALKADDAKGTYDTDTVLVYHFNEHGSPAVDASGSGNSAQNAGFNSDGSMIGSGLKLDGAKALIIPAAPSLQIAEGGLLTWSAWVKPSVLQPNAVIYSRRDAGNGWVIGLDKGVPYLEVTDGSGIHRSANGAAVAVNAWHHLAVVAEAGKMTLFLDGEPYGTLTTPLPALNSIALLGGDSTPGSTEPPVVSGGFIGELDELEISKVARPVGFIKLAAIGQGGEKAAKLLVFDPDEQPSSILSWFKGGYFGIIISSLTFDGWAVIIILMLMMLLSWYVMITKVKYMNEMGKGNALFLKEWSHVATDLTILDDDDSEKSKSLGGRIDSKSWKTMRSSSVYRIYHTGVEEIQHRLTADRALVQRKGLSGRSIQAIRASLDGTLVRETQKINKLIVLLTICISGGPFLGLLGTVVGVMITFAAVAAAGDVNVNAIAPGIAAALLATVAGLAVAIPALFGYNYILSLVKDAKDDMHIFIDEFVTKMAEFYKE